MRTAISSMGVLEPFSPPFNLSPNVSREENLARGLAILEAAGQ